MPTACASVEQVRRRFTRIMNCYFFPSDLVRSLRTSLLMAFLLSLAGCAGNKYVWARDVPVERSRPIAETLAIGRGDILSVQVVGQASLSAQQTVGADGTINLIDVGVVMVAGLTVDQATQAIEQKLTKILQAPRVSLFVLSRFIEVSILGEVESPGKYKLESGDGVANAIAMAGGMTEFGDGSAIYLVRKSEPVRVRFRMRDLLKGGTSAHDFALSDGDILIVE